MALTFSLREKLEGMGEAVKRFPLAAVCIVLTCILLLIITHNRIEFNPFNLGLIIRLLILSIAGIFISLNMQLAKEAGDFSDKIIRTAGGLLVLVFLLTMTVFASPQMLSFCGALLTLLVFTISLTPYLKKKDDLSFWFFSRQVAQGMGFSILAALVVGIGVSLTLLTLKTLFGVSIPPRIYADVWILAFFGFAPFYALTWVPQRFTYAEEDCHTPKQLAVFLNWIGAPLLLFYMGILYAYFVKVALLGEITVNELSSMILTYGLIGVSFVAASWPLLQTGALSTRLMGRYFFPALLLPSLLSLWLIIDRVLDFGMTESRYFVLIGSIYLLILSAVFLIKKGPTLRFMSLLAVISIFVTSLPFVGAFGISKFTQKVRLTHVLEQNGYFEGGQYKVPDNLPNQNVQRNISSIAEYLSDSGKNDVIEDVTGEKIGNKRYYDFSEIFGFKRVGRYDRSEPIEGRRVTLNWNTYHLGGVTYMDGYDAYLNNSRFKQGDNDVFGVRPKEGKTREFINAVLGEDTLVLKKDEVSLSEYDLTPALKMVLKKGQDSDQKYIDVKDEKPISIRSRDEQSEIFLTRITSTIDGNKAEVYTLNGTIRFKKSSPIYKAVQEIAQDK